MAASGFRVRVTGLVFVFNSASLALKQVPTCIWKPKTFDKSVNFILVIFGRFIWFQVVLGCFTLVSTPNYDVTKIRLPRTKCLYNIFHKQRTGSSKIHKIFRKRFQFVYYMWLNLSFIVYPVLEKFRKYMWGGAHSF